MAIVAPRGTERFLSERIGIVDPRGGRHWVKGVQSALRCGHRKHPKEGPDLEAARRCDEAQARRIESEGDDAGRSDEHEGTMRVIRRMRGPGGEIHEEVRPLSDFRTDA
mgnify:FL=1